MGYSRKKPERAGVGGGGKWGEVEAILFGKLLEFLGFLLYP